MWFVKNFTGMFFNSLPEITCPNHHLSHIWHLEHKIQTGAVAGKTKKFAWDRG